jgi:hypothetical protein
MSIDFIGRDQWRQRGRPRVPADPKALEALRTTYRTGQAARVRIREGTDPAEIRSAITQLRRAADELGLHLRLQPRRSKDILDAGEMRFFAEDR